MKKVLLIILTLLIPINISALEYPKLHYNNAMIYDLTDKEILYELNSNDKESIASLTKLVTIITAIENIKDLNQTIIYDKNMQKQVSWNASVAGFKIGDKLTYNDLLYAAMLPSGADATIALAISISGNIDNFVIKMNELAKRIGMKNSNFVNVHGLDQSNHYSTVEDIRKLLEYSLKNETFKKVYTTKTYTLSTSKEIKSTVQKQADKFNLNLSKVIGSKTGFTGNAGLCISFLMSHQNHEILVITLGAPTTSTIPYNITDSINLISFIESNYNNHIIIPKNNIVKTITVQNSKIESYEIKTKNSISLFLENDYNKEDIKIEYKGLETVSYKNKKSEKIGNVTYYYKNKKIGSEEIRIEENIKVDIMKIIKNNSSLIIYTIIVISFLMLVHRIIKTIKSKKTL